MLQTKKLKPSERRDRSDEFANWSPRPRAPVQGSSVVMALCKGPLAPQRVTATTTDAEREYMGRVAALGCVVCRLLGFGATPAQVHHIRTGQGGAQRAGNYCTLPLCEPHHQGPQGIHGDRSCLRQLNLTEFDLLDITIGELST